MSAGKTLAQIKTEGFPEGVEIVGKRVYQDRRVD